MQDAGRVASVRPRPIVSGVPLQGRDAVPDGGRETTLRPQTFLPSPQLRGGHTVQDGGRLAALRARLAELPGYPLPEGDPLPDGGGVAQVCAQVAPPQGSASIAGSLVRQRPLRERDGVQDGGRFASLCAKQDGPSAAFLQSALPQEDHVPDERWVAPLRPPRSLLQRHPMPEGN